MKYTKSAAALALAGVAASPLVQADGHEDSGVTVTLSGQVAIGIIGSDADEITAIDIGDQLPDATSATGFRAATADDVRDAARPGDLTMFGDDSTINVKAEGAIGGGLTGYGNYRTDLGLVGDTATGDNIHVGIKGDFGDVRIGEVPDATGYGQITDILSGSDIDNENFGVSYTGKFGGVTFGANWSPEGSSDRIAAGVKFSAGGFGIGIGAGDDAGRSELSVGATFALAGASVGVGYKDLDNGLEFINATVGYGISGWSLGLTFETSSGDVNADDNQIRFDAGYDLGNGMNVSGRVNVITDDDDSDGDLTDYRVLLTKAF